MYFMIASALALVAGTWQIQEWRHDAKEKSAIDRAVKDHRKQQKTDQALLFKAEIEKREMRGIYNALKKQIHDITSSDCVYSTDFIRLWNEANRQAGASITD